MVCRALEISVRQAQEIIRVGIIESHASSPRLEGITTIDVEDQKLVELLIAHVAAKLETVVADDPAIVVRKLERIADLRQLASRVVPNRKACPAYGNERHALKFGAHTCVNSKVGGVGTFGGGTCRRRARGK